MSFVNVILLNFCPVEMLSIGTHSFQSLTLESHSSSLNNGNFVYCIPTVVLLYYLVPSVLFMLHKEMYLPCQLLVEVALL